MQEVLLEENILMANKQIDMNMLSRVDSDQKATVSRVDSLQASLAGIGREVSELRGLITASETPWWVRSIVAPVCVAVILATGGAVIHLEIVASGVESFIHNNGGVIAGLRLQEALSDSRNFHEVGQILKQAEESKVQIPSGIIEETGSRFISISSSDLNAWGAALQFATYRSDQINPTQLPHLGLITPLDTKTTLGLRFWMPSAKEEKHYFDVTAAGIVYSPNEAPAFELLGDPKAFPPFKGGGYPKYLIWDDRNLPREQKVPLPLDLLHLRNVVLKNVPVMYEGGQTQLENVYFINCEFLFKPSEAARELAQKILSSTAVSFSQP
jgi:hypothetical protein